ncbi:hypothetical protein Q4508_15225 [Amphritea sp. 2_MG-2023]|uniref:sacsin N-terminal ATP-binding-like domain-containing protein n=1 Tax=Amphritea TaxID=515417 RepID=UPI001C0739DB|nr:MULTISPECIES: hypothetical protein [Amphritea]MBU2964928.1 hypothetical protein [Amphritea atlantica]MDO6419909.1 hypothetical protein [Amphritea sp. 2_MG-2023]
MSGFIQDPIQFINLIADNLRDRYQTGFPVLKELIQNTDDAPATELHYGLSPGLKNAAHPLLQGPGLFLINNGEFKATDARGIRSFGQNAKAADQSSIGKFGLGMKSVFHFCEAFFFLAHDGDRSYAEVLNPWSGPEDMDSLHREWDIFSDNDAQLMRQSLSCITDKIAKSVEHCFILWLPLRQKSHLELPNGEHSGAIVSEFPGDDKSLLNFLDDEMLPVKIAALLPMLRTLERISFWQFDNSGDCKIKFEVALGENTARPPLISMIHSEDSVGAIRHQNIKGRVEVLNGKNKQTMAFQGFEHFGWSQRLTELHNNEFWPSSYVRGTLGREQEAKDKAKPHGTVFFSRIAGRGRLTANWSVFLPLDEKHAAETVTINGDYHFRLTLHGYFFIDAGRQGIHGRDSLNQYAPIELDNEEALRRAWNQELLNHAVLPLLLPALDAFCRDQRLTDKACTELSRGLGLISWVKRFREQITLKNCWIRELRKNSAGWVLRPSNKPVLSLPSPPEKDSERPWRLFTTLDDIAEDYHLTLLDSPNVIHHKQEAQWSEADLLRLFKRVNPELFSDGKLLDYFTQFLAQSAGPFLNVGSVNSLLRNIFKEGLMRYGEAGLGRNQKLVCDIVSHFVENHCFCINDNLPDLLIKQLMQSGIDTVLIPKRFYPSEWKGGELSVGDAYELLCKVDDALNHFSSEKGYSYKSTLDLSEQIIKGVKAEDRPALIQRCARLNILEAYDCKAKASLAISPSKLAEAKNNALLFGYSPGVTPNERLGLATDLQQVLPDDRVLIINADKAKLIFEEKLQPCNSNAVLGSLGTKSRTLGDSKVRASLASKLGMPEGDIEIQGLRFLLHTSQAHFESVNDSLWILGDEQHPVWLKLWSQLVDDEENPWNLIDSGVADSLARDKARKVGIKEIRAADVIEDLCQQGFSSIDADLFDREECEQILSAIKDDQLWIKAPFHWSHHNKPVPGDAQNVYFTDDSQSVDQKLLQNIDLIFPSADPALAQRQKNLLPPLDENAHIQILLSNTQTISVWRKVMDILESLHQLEQQPAWEVEQKIKATAWITTTEGDLVAPKDIVYLPAATAELESVQAKIPGSFSLETALSDNFKTHAYYSRARDAFFATGSEGVAKLASVMGVLKPYWLGGISIADNDELQQSAQTLSAYNHPGWQLLFTLSANECYEKPDLMPLFNALNKGTEIEVLVEIMNWLASLERSDKTTLQIFNAYLKAFSQRPHASDFLQNLKLFAQDKQWRDSEDLVSGVEGISAGCMLDYKQGQILSKVIKSDDTHTASKTNAYSSNRGDPAAAANIVRNYFQPWTGRVPSALTALFTLLLGRDDGVQQLCDEHLGQHSREWLIKQIPWTIPEDIEHGAYCWLYGDSLEEAIDKFRMSVTVHSGESKAVLSILGETITVPLNDKPSNLFIDKPKYYKINESDDYQVDLELRKVSSETLSDEQLSELLRKSSEYLLREVYNQKKMQLDSLWVELSKSDQVDIKLAQALILKNIPFYLKQLGTHKHPSLSDHLTQYRDFETKEQEFSDKPEADIYKAKHEQVLQHIKQIIESDETAQQAILESVRRKVGDFQYQPENIPFELFQNADDALQDLELIIEDRHSQGQVSADPIRKLVIDIAQDSLVFIHWGRAINQFGNNADLRRDKGFDRDLENMLILSASDKEEGVTGKFGLGFKSVWLISERPTIVSGRLQAEITGGLLPTPTNNPASQTLRYRMAELHRQNQWPGTGLHLPLVDDHKGCELIKPFKAVAGLLVAFARKINTLELCDSAGQTQRVVWDAKPVLDCQRLTFGRIDLPSGHLSALKITLKDSDIIIPFGPDGFQVLPEKIPSLWVTAPLKERDYLGFAINAMFEIDAGRSRLSADAAANTQRAELIGQQLSESLDHLYQAVEEQWPQLVSVFNLNSDITRYQFWNSLWKVIFSRLPRLSKESGVRIIAETILKGGLHKLATQQRAVPNGLAGEYGRCIRSGDVRYVLKGALNQNALFSVVADIPCFQGMLDANMAITEERSTWLKLVVPEFASTSTQWMTVNLSSLVSSTDALEISPSDAEKLGSVLNASTLKTWQEADAPADQIKDFEKFSEIAHELMFRNQKGQKTKAQNLLLHKQEGDEALRWGFAPSDYRLSDDYGANARAFFQLCREKMNAPAEKLKDWVLQAEGNNRRVAALHYLIKGELARQVTELLHHRGLNGTWLAEISDDSELLSDWDDESRSTLIYKVLKTAEEIKWQFRTVPEFYDIQPQSHKPIDAAETLNNIYHWWGEHRHQYLKDYQRETFPNTHKTNYLDDDLGDYNRSSWLTLLLLGGFHTMGRMKPSQHRGFIETCQHRGWWEVFTATHPEERFKDWMKVLDQFIGEQVDEQSYEYWMARFPIIYKLSRRLDDYAELFLGFERYQKPFDLAKALTPSADTDQQGGGIIASPLRNTLGIGANFVVRELIRNNVIDTPYLREHAYVPYKKVRLLLAEMGCDLSEDVLRHQRSPMIAQFIEEKIGNDKATFYGDYDIPLRIVAEDQWLQEELIGCKLPEDEVLL